MSSNTRSARVVLVVYHLGELIQIIWIKVCLFLFYNCYIHCIKRMFNVRLLQRWLLVFVPLMGASMLTTYFLGFVIGFILTMFMFIVVILYIQRKNGRNLGLMKKKEETKLCLFSLWQ